MDRADRRGEPTAYAHTLEGRPQQEWQTLEDHLCQVSQLAAGFAAGFGNEGWGALAGLWHDLGKLSPEFQRRLAGGRRRVDHSTAGARHAVDVLGERAGWLMAYMLAGHHAGLPDGRQNEDACLAKRLEKAIPELPGLPRYLAKAPALPRIRLGHAQDFSLSFFVRMVFSCLVDADFLDTERFMNPEKYALRESVERPGLDGLKNRLDAHLAGLGRGEGKKIDLLRRRILADCRGAAAREPGLFSLTAPTGGGKTLSSLAFALDHAAAHGLRRVIYAIPYTSIIEQNAAVFRDVLGPEAVLEHHSNFEPRRENKNEDHHPDRLAAENWDAPLVVTTNVQLFESLFASRASRCRRLHNIAGSVIILDEAQTLPAELLRPALAALTELAANYQVSVVVCTATQPALTAEDEFKGGLQNVREIACDPQGLYQEARRVEIENLGRVKAAELAARMRSQPQVLTVVNTRRHARALYQAIGGAPGSFHLSTYMCPRHRKRALDEIRRRLKAGEDCRVVSTQLIEAGVDVDFPVVYRALAGLDSIAQAAGRCNREGRLEKATAYIFQPEDEFKPPLGHLRQASDAAEEILRHHQDPLAIEAIREYFKKLYWLKGSDLDKNKILPLLTDNCKKLDFPFRQVARLFRMIEQETTPLVIPFDAQARELIEQLSRQGPDRKLTRALQPYTIQLYAQELARLERAGAVRELGEYIPVRVLNELSAGYKPDIGLDLAEAGLKDEAYIQ